MHIPWAVLINMFIRQPNIPLKRPCPGASMVGSFIFFAPSIFILEKHVLILCFRLGGPFSRRQFWPRIWRALGVPRGEIYLFYFIFKNWYPGRTVGEKQNLEGRFVRFDKDTHPYDFKLVGGKRLVSSIRSVFCDITHAYFRRCRTLYFVASHQLCVEYFWTILRISGHLKGASA